MDFTFADSNFVIRENEDGEILYFIPSIQPTSKHELKGDRKKCLRVILSAIHDCRETLSVLYREIIIEISKPTLYFED